MGAAPSIPTDNSRKLQVIGAGYIRTGTLSFAMACETLLEGPAWHGGSQILHREDGLNPNTPYQFPIQNSRLIVALEYVKKWFECYKYRHDKPRLHKLLRELTAGFVATSDFPAGHFAPDLLEIYPDAVVVCVTRDREKWWRSCEPVVRNAQSWFLDVLLWSMPGWRWWTSLMAGFRATDGEHFGVTYARNDVAPEPSKSKGRGYCTTAIKLINARYDHKT